MPVNDDIYDNFWASILAGADIAKGKTSCPPYIDPSAYNLYVELLKNSTAAATSCTDIKQFVINHQVDYKEFVKVNNDIAFVCPCYLLNKTINKLGTTHAGEKLSLSTTELVNCIANFCLEHKIWFDDTTTSTFEKAEILKLAIGKGLEDAGCYLSQPLKQATVVKNTNAQATAATNSATKSSQAKSSYKSAGPQSQNATGVYTPNKKDYATGSYVYAVQAATKSTVRAERAFINPMLPKGKASNNRNKVFFGTSNGYTDCTCYFFDSADAQTFLTAIKQFNSLATKSINVVKLPANKNGYFKVATAVGDCYIVAQRLNEDTVNADATKTCDEATESKNDAKVAELRDRATNVLKKASDPDLAETFNILDTAMHR